MALEHTYARTVTIGTTGSGLSAAVSVAGGIPVGLIVSSTWTPADITFQASAIGSTTFHDLTDFAGTAMQSTGVAADIWINLDPAVFAGIDRLKVRSGTSTGLAQAATRTLTLVCLERDDRGRR